MEKDVGHIQMLAIMAIDKIVIKLENNRIFVTKLRTDMEALS